MRKTLYLLAFFPSLLLAQGPNQGEVLNIYSINSGEIATQLRGISQMLSTNSIIRSADLSITLSPDSATLQGNAISISTNAGAVNTILASSNTLWIPQDGSTNTKRGGIQIDGSFVVRSSITVSSTIVTGREITFGSRRFVMPDSLGTANQVLETDGSGNLSWGTDDSGGQLLYNLVIGTFPSVSGSVDIASNTQAGFQDAINRFPIRSTGSIWVRPGIYEFSSGISLPSHISIYFADGAIIKSPTANESYAFFTVNGKLYNVQPVINRDSVSTPVLDLKWGAKVVGLKPASHFTDGTAGAGVVYRIFETSDVVVEDVYFAQLNQGGGGGGSSVAIFEIEDSTNVILRNVVSPADYVTTGANPSLTFFNIIGSDNILVEGLRTRDIYQCIVISDDGTSPVGRIVFRDFSIDLNTDNGRVGGVVTMTSDSGGGVSTGVVFMNGTIHRRGSGDNTNTFYFDSTNSPTVGGISYPMLTNISVSRDSGSNGTFMLAGSNATNGARIVNLTMYNIQVSGQTTFLTDNAEQTKCLDCRNNGASVDQ